MQSDHLQEFLQCGSLETHSDSRRQHVVRVGENGVYAMKGLVANGRLTKGGSLDGKEGWEDTEGAALKPYCDPQALEHIFWAQAKITQVGGL